MSSTELSSIVYVPSYLEQFQKLDSGDLLAQLHFKFWGRDMAENEQVRGADQQLTSNLSKGEDDGKEDDEEREDEGKTGYVLKIGNDAIYMDKIFVRAEFVRIYDYIVSYYDKKTKFRGKAPMAVVTGQPGIGKSVWIYYALCRCLAERRPVIWRYNSQPYIFLEKGVYDMGKDFLGATYQRFVWTLIDSDASKDGVPVEFVDHDSHFFVIYASSPASGRWSRMEKTVSIPQEVVMNPWSRSEIHRAAPLHPTSPSLEIIDNTFDQFGPTPRLCFEIAADNRKLEAYKETIQDALNDLTTESLRTLTEDLQKLKMNAISHRLCLIRRSKKHDLDSDFLVMPITDYIRSELVIRLRNSSMRQLIKTYHKFFPILALRGMCGIVFESICHLRFQERINIRHMKMVRLSKPANFQWRSSHNPIEDHRLEERRNDAFHEGVTFEVCPSKCREYDGKGLTPEPGVYYIAKKPNQAGFDSFIFYKDTLYLFQFTVFALHDINDELIAECSKLSIPEDKWLFIFVIPDGVKLLKCPYSKSPKLRRLEPRSAEIVVE